MGTIILPPFADKGAQEGSIVCAGLHTHVTEAGFAPRPPGLGVQGLHYEGAEDVRLGQGTGETVGSRGPASRHPLKEDEDGLDTCHVTSRDRVGSSPKWGESWHVAGQV